MSDPLILPFLAASFLSSSRLPFSYFLTFFSMSLSLCPLFFSLIPSSFLSRHIISPLFFSLPLPSISSCLFSSSPCISHPLYSITRLPSLPLNLRKVNMSDTFRLKVIPVNTFLRSPQRIQPFFSWACLIICFLKILWFFYVQSHIQSWRFII